MKRDLRVLYLNNKDIVRYGFGSVYHISAVSGPTNLIQKIVYYLLTETESNFYSPMVGSSFSMMSNANWSPENENIIKAGLTTAISDIETKIKLSQVLRTLEPEESLNKLEIRSIEYDPQNHAWNVTIDVINMLNQTFTISI